jgi:hypothetical protein
MRAWKIVISPDPEAPDPAPGHAFAHTEREVRDLVRRTRRARLRAAPGYTLARRVRAAALLVDLAASRGLRLAVEVLSDASKRTGSMADPTMPERPPIAALTAIAQIKGFRSWEPVEMYQAIREALQEPREYAPEKRMPGGGRPPGQ